jgi:hypothetical protein
MNKRYFICLLALLFIQKAQAQTTNYQVYALFVVNIAKYSSWPSVNGEMHIAILGKSKVYDELMKQNGKSVNGQVVKIYQVESVQELGDAHIVFIPDGRSSMLDDVLKATSGRSVMVIAEREGLYKKGAGFSFVIMENSTLRYDVNNTELEKRQIKVSKSLTALANAMI